MGFFLFCFFGSGFGENFLLFGLVGGGWFSFVVVVIGCGGLDVLCGKGWGFDGV